MEKTRLVGVYTDASVDIKSKQVGLAAVYTNNRIIKETARVPNKIKDGVTWSELHAIYVAVTDIRDHFSHGHFIVRSDSSSAVRHVEGAYVALSRGDKYPVAHAVDQKALEIAHVVHKINKRKDARIVRIAWVKGHIKKNKHNGAADSLARYMLRVARGTVKERESPRSMMLGIARDMRSVDYSVWLKKNKKVFDSAGEVFS